MIVPAMLYVYLVLLVASAILLPHGIIRQREEQATASAVMLAMSFIGFMSNLFYGLRWL